MPQPDPTPAMEFDCPLCGGAFEADLAMLGQEVECPHCGEVVELPDDQEVAAPPTRQTPVSESTPADEAGERQASRPPAVSDRPAPEAVAIEQPIPVEPASTGPAAIGLPPAEPATRGVPLTREQRAAARRRFNLILAGVGAVILVLVFVLLVNLG